MRQRFANWRNWLQQQPWRSRRVPVLLQLSANECGAACLAMILSFYGRQTRIADCRGCLDSGRDGATAKMIAQAARAHGLRVRALSVQGAMSDMRFVQLPAIAHWEFNHFVVVERWTPQQVTLVDPAQGRRQISSAAWEAGFTGIILAMEPGPQFAPQRQRMYASWQTYLGHLLHIPGTRLVLSQVIAASLGLQLLGLALPLLTKVLLDTIIPLQLISLMGALALGMGLWVAAQVVIGYLRSALLIYVQARLDAHMMLGFFEHVLALPFRFFQARSTGDLLMRLSSNTVIRETLTSQTITLVLDGGFVLVYFAILVALAPSFAALVLGLGLLQLLVVWLSTSRARELMRQYLVAQAAAQSYLVEALNGIATFKASGAEPRIFERWTNLFFQQLNLSLKRDQLGLLIDTALGGLRLISPLLLLWLGTRQVLAGSTTVGSMVALNTLALSVLSPLVSFATNIQRLHLVSAHLERLGDVLDATPEQPAGSGQLVRPLQGQIELREVGFRYDAQAPLALDAVSLTIMPGQKVAFVGRTGSGKSTLAKLILGLHTPTTGAILFDGEPLANVDYRHLRSQIGVVLQEASLLSGSIRDNIALNHPDLSLEQVANAARLAVIDQDIRRLPMGYETRIAEGSSSLSGGQRQRLCLARALAHQPVILVLDEATSHLDSATEQQVEANLSQLASTRIVIAHRLSTVRNADLIVVLEDGRIVEQGTHDQLVALHGLYARLIHSQAPSADAWAVSTGV